MQNSIKYLTQSFNKRLKFFGLLVFLFFLSANDCFGQSITWQRTYDGPFQWTDIGEDICDAGNGNFYIIGTTVRPNSFSSIFVLKINKMGDTLWSRFVDTAYGKAIVTSGDGGCVFTGYRDVAFTSKIDSNGNLVWFKKYSANIVFSGLDIIQTPDNGYMVCGVAYYDSACVFKTDSLGSLQWIKIFQAGGRKIFKKLIKGIDNGVVLFGFQENWFNDTARGLITKIDLNGNILQERTFVIKGNTDIYDVDINGNGYIITGDIYDYNDFFVYVKKLDIDLDDTFTKVFQSDDDETTSRIKTINHNKFVLSAARLTNSFPFIYYTKIFLIDSTGNILNQKYYYALGDLYIYGIIPIPNGDIIFAGYSEFSAFPVKPDIYVLRTDSLLNAPPPIGIEPVNNEIPNEFSLLQNYPNPFNPVTNIKFEIPKDVNVSMKIYDIRGREVFSINEYKKAGSYEVQFDGTNFASGIYFYKMVVGELPGSRGTNNGDVFTDTKKMVLLK